MTAYTSDEVKNRCKEVGMNDYISKPVDFNYLSTLLDVTSSNVETVINGNTLIDLHAAKLSRIINFDHHICVELTTTFITQLKEAFVKIEGLRLKNDMYPINQIVHKMKGGSATVRLEKINHLFIKVETLILNNKYQEAFEVIDQIKEFPILKKSC
jgi:HPt (histidine-containing phosphotransfer) domain-containing protein